MANNKQNGSDKAKADLAKAAQASAKRQSQKNQSKGKKSGGILSYFRGVRQEFRKVVWPTREELTTDTVVVVACVAFFALAFWLIDTGFLAALKGILGITLS
ncbi:MAG: preprotein translocase subunit SecE [Mogibacterium sp.]|nr:preprotein translocase subunit SecE [Mogibacterium sp.]MBR2540121.1 preprotein translocase subunit SecE [Mogibacterium sp.]